MQEAMKKVAYSFIITRRPSVQEAVYNILPELLPGISFININLPKNRIKMIKSKEQLNELSDDSTDVFKRNIIDRYFDCPACDKFACLKNVCLAKVAPYYYKKSTSENGYQLGRLEEDISNKNINFPIGLPNNITSKKHA